MYTTLYASLLYTKLDTQIKTRQQRICLNRPIWHNAAPKNSPKSKKRSWLYIKTSLETIQFFKYIFYCDQHF